MAVQINVAANQAALVQSIQAGVQAYNQRFANQNPINLQINARAFSQPLGRITGDVKDFEAALAASNARVIAFGASTAVLGGVLRGFRSIAEVTIEVEKNLADINRVFGLTTKELQKFSTDLFNVSKLTASSFKDASQAALEFSRQGVKAEEVLQRTADAMTLARLAGMNVNNAIEALTATVNGFQATGITTTQVLNKLVAVEQNYAVSAGDLAEALSRTGLAAQEAGVNIDQLNALVTAAQEKTARGGAVIGNALKTIFTRLQRTETLDQLEAFNIGVRDIQGNILPAVQILQNFASAYNGLADAQRSQLSEQVAGVYQVNILKAIIGDLNNKQGAYAGALQKGATATNEAQIAAAKLNQTLDALLSQTGTVAQQFANNIGKVTFEPLAKYTAESFKSLFENLNEILEGEGLGSTFANGLLKGIRNILAGPGAIGAFFVLFKLIQNSFSYLTQALPQIVGITTETQNRKNIEQAILQIMQQQSPVAQALAGQMGNQTAQAQLLLQLARQQTAEYQRQQALVAALAPTLAAQGVTVRGSGGLGVTRSKGYLPNFYEETSAKAQGASNNVTAVPGVGKIGGKSFIANNQEIQIPHFAGTNETAVIPTYGGGIEKAIAMIGSGKSGSILNRGFVPNFASISTRKMNELLFPKTFATPKGSVRSSSYQIDINNLDATAKNLDRTQYVDVVEKMVDAGYSNNPAEKGKYNFINDKLFGKINFIKYLQKDELDTNVNSIWEVLLNSNMQNKGDFFRNNPYLKQLGLNPSDVATSLSRSLNKNNITLQDLKNKKLIFDQLTQKRINFRELNKNNQFKTYYNKKTKQPLDTAEQFEASLDGDKINFLGAFYETALANKSDLKGKYIVSKDDYSPADLVKIATGTAGNDYLEAKAGKAELPQIIRKALRSKKIQTANDKVEPVNFGNFSVYQPFGASLIQSRGYIPNFAVKTLIPGPQALQQILLNQQNKKITDLDFDGTLSENQGNIKYLQAKTQEERDAVLNKYFRNEEARMADIINSPLTSFGAQLLAGINNKTIDPNYLGIMTASDASPKLISWINKTFKIPTQNIKGGIRGIGGGSILEAKKMLAEKFANKGTGGSAIVDDLALAHFNGYIPSFADDKDKLPQEYRNLFTGKLNNAKIASAIRMGKLDPAVAQAAGYKTSASAIEERKQGVLERVKSLGYKAIGLSAGIGKLNQSNYRELAKSFGNNFENIAFNKAQKLFSSQRLAFAKNYKKGGTGFWGAPNNTRIDALSDNISGPLFEFKSGDVVRSEIINKFTQAKNELIEMWAKEMPQIPIDDITNKINKRQEILMYNADKSILQGSKVIQAAKGFIPNFSVDDEEDELGDPISRKTGSQLGIDSSGALNVGFLSSEYGNPLMELKSVLESGKVKNINAGRIVGPRIPNIIVGLKKLLPLIRQKQASRLSKNNIDPVKKTAFINSILKLNELYLKHYAAIDASLRYNGKPLDANLKDEIIAAKNESFNAYKNLGDRKILSYLEKNTLFPKFYSNLNSPKLYFTHKSGFLSDLDKLDKGGEKILDRIPITGSFNPQELIMNLLKGRGKIVGGKRISKFESYSSNDLNKLRSAFKEMGVDEKSLITVDLETIYPQGLNKGFIPNFVDSAYILETLKRIREGTSGFSETEKAAFLNKFGAQKSNIPSAIKEFDLSRMKEESIVAFIGNLKAQGLSQASLKLGKNDSILKYGNFRIAPKGPTLSGGYTDFKLLAKGFIPNFAADYINRVMDLESNMSGNNAILDTKTGPFPFIRNSSQPNFAAAISDHGGLNNALSDSLRNQTNAGLMNGGYVPNFATLNVQQSLGKQFSALTSQQQSQFISLNRALSQLARNTNLTAADQQILSNTVRTNAKALEASTGSTRIVNDANRALATSLQQNRNAQAKAAQQAQQQTQQNSGSSTSRLGRLSSGLSRAGTAISIAGPSIAGFAEQAFFGNRERIDMTRGERIGKEAVGQGLSAITTGAGIGSAFGGLPGALIGGFIGSLVGLTSALNAAELSTEELNKKLEKQIQAGSENISAAQKYIEAQKTLSGLITSGASQKEIDTASKAVADSFKEIKDVDLAKSLLETKGGVDALNNALAPFQKKQKANEEISNLIATPDKQFSQSLFKFLSEKGQKSLIQSISSGFFSKTPEEYFGAGSQGARMAYIPNMLEQGKTFQQLQYTEQNRIVDAIISSVDSSIDEETKSGLKQKLQKFLSESKNSKDLTNQFTELVEMANQFSANQIQINRDAVSAYKQRNQFELENIAALAEIDRELRSSQFGQKLAEKLFDFQDKLSENLISPLDRINAKFAFETKQLETKTNDEIKKINRDFAEKIVSLQQKITGPELTQFQNAVTESRKGNIEGLKSIVNPYGPSQIPPEVIKALEEELKKREEQLRLSKENQQNELGILNQDKSLTPIKERYAQIMNNLLIKDIELTGRKERLEMERKATLELELDRLSRREADPAEFFGLSVLGEADKKSILMREKSAQKIADIETSGTENARQASLEVMNIRRQQLLDQAQFMESQGLPGGYFKNQAENLTGNNFTIDKAIQDLESRKFATNEQEKQRVQTLEKLKNIQQQINIDKEKEGILTQRNTADLQRDAQRAVSFRYGLESSLDKMNKEADMIGRRLGEQIPTLFADGMTNALMEVAKGTKSIGDAFQDMAINFGQMLMQEVMRAAVGKIVGSIGSSLFQFQTGGIVGKQTGGIIRAENGMYIPGNRNGDRNLAMLEDGEYVLNRNAVESIGVSNLDSLNYGMAPRFQRGGIAKFAQGGSFGGGFMMEPEYQQVGDQYNPTGNILQSNAPAKPIDYADYSSYALSEDEYFQETKRKSVEDFQRGVRERFEAQAKEAKLISSIVGAIGSITMSVGMAGYAAAGAAGQAATSGGAGAQGAAAGATGAASSGAEVARSSLKAANPALQEGLDEAMKGSNYGLGRFLQKNADNILFNGETLSNAVYFKDLNRFSLGQLKDFTKVGDLRGIAGLNKITSVLGGQTQRQGMFGNIFPQVLSSGRDFTTSNLPGRQTGGLVGYQSGGFIPYGSRISDNLPRYMSGGNVMSNPSFKKFTGSSISMLQSGGQSSNTSNTYNQNQNNATQISINIDKDNRNTIGSSTSSYKPNEVALSKEMALAVNSTVRKMMKDEQRYNGILSQQA